MSEAETMTEASQGNILERVRRIWSQLTLAQRIGGALITLLTFGGLLSIAMNASRPDYQTLYASLSAEQSASITEALEQRQIPYELESSSTVLVPSERVHEARVFLAGQGLPSDGGSGFELFDKNEFGMTAFTQKVNYQRAMEAELARTVGHIGAVRAARVHLVLPERSLFQDDRRDPTASVALTLRPGGALESVQIRSIRHLIASAVEGLDARDITIIDESGALLARPRAAGIEGAGGEGDALRAARAIEREFEERIMALLAPVVGPSGARVEASVDLETRTVRETAELYDPESSALRREKRSEERRQRGEASEAGGAAGAAAQLGAAAPAQAAGGEGSESVDEVLEYEIDKRVRETTEVGPRVKRVSVAVLLDQASVEPAPGAEGEPVDLERVRALVAGAVGIDKARGDRLEVSTERFRPVERLVPEPLPFYQEPAFLASAIRYGSLAAVALLLIVFVARPVVRAVTKAAEPAPELALVAADEIDDQTPDVVGRSIEELMAEQDGGVTIALSEVVDPAREHQRRLRAEVLELGQADLDRTSQIISQWMRADAGERVAS